MKRVVLYVLILAALPAAPVRYVDIAQLRPVEVVWVYREDGQVVIRTDTQDTGRGGTAQQAIEQLHQCAPAVIYLDTAEYLIVAENAREDAVRLEAVLKSSVKVCLSRGELDLSAVSQYLNVHGQLPQLKQWRNGEKPPLLTTENGQIKIFLNCEKSA